MLGMPEQRVRELARDALVDLAPVSGRGVEEDWRGQLADYVLGQQSGPEATATRGHLRRSEAARTWARSLLDSLEQLYQNGSMPAIPEGERGRRAAARRPRSGATRSRRATVAESRRRRRRWLLAGAAAPIVLLLVVLVWPSASSPAATTTARRFRSSHAAAAQPAAPTTAVPARRGGRARPLAEQRAVAAQVQASRAPAQHPPVSYQFWLYNNKNNASSLGAQVTDAARPLQVAIGILPAGLPELPLLRPVAASPSAADRAHSGQLGAERDDAHARIVRATASHAARPGRAAPPPRRS